MTRMPSNDNMKSRSAILSSFLCFFSFFDLMDVKEKKQDTASSIPIIPVNSSTKVFCDLSVVWNAVITNRQNPNKVAAVLRICGEVVFGITHCKITVLP